MQLILEFSNYKGSRNPWRETKFSIKILLFVCKTIWIMWKIIELHNPTPLQILNSLISKWKVMHILNLVLLIFRNYSCPPVSGAAFCSLQTHIHSERHLLDFDYRHKILVATRIFMTINSIDEVVARELGPKSVCCPLRGHKFTTQYAVQVTDNCL